jgi:hypothetical protein
MKRFIICLALVLLMAFPASATIITSSTGTDTLAFDSTQMGIMGNYGVQCIAMKFYDADVGLEFYLQSVRQDTTLQLAGEAILYHTPCDTIIIHRAVATAGLYLIGSPSGDICPNIGDNYDAPAPEPVTDNHTTLCENFSLGATTYKCVSATNIDVLGARSLYLLLDWSGGSINNQIGIEPFFSISATDTSVSQHGYVIADSLNIIEASYVGDKAIIEIDIKNTVAGGYFNCRIRTTESGTVTDIDVKLLEVY